MVRAPHLLHKASQQSHIYLNGLLSAQPLFRLPNVVLLSAVDDIPELLSSSSLFSMLLPLILAYIGPVATSVPKVRWQKPFSTCFFRESLLSRRGIAVTCLALPNPGCRRGFRTRPGAVTCRLRPQPKVRPPHLQPQPVDGQHDGQPAGAGPVGVHHLEPLLGDRERAPLQASQRHTIQGTASFGMRLAPVQSQRCTGGGGFKVSK